MNIVLRSKGVVFFRPSVVFALLWGVFWGTVVVVASKNGWRKSFSGRDVEETDNGNYLDSTIHTQVAFVVSLLLGFKANQAWNRHWLGTLTVRSMQNALVAGISCAVGNVEPGYHRNRMVHYLMASYHLSLTVLRDGRPGNYDMADTFSPREKDILAAMLPRHRPAYAMAKGLSKVSAVVKMGKAHTPLTPFLPQQFAAINAGFTTAYELKSNPLPLPFINTLYWILLFLTATLPLTIAVTQGWATPVTTGLIAYALFAVDAISIELEDPFGDDPNDIDLVAMEDAAMEQVSKILAASPIIDHDMLRVQHTLDNHDDDDDDDDDDQAAQHHDLEEDPTRFLLATNALADDVGSEHMPLLSTSP